MDKLSAVKKILEVKFLGKKVPLVVTWPITNRCNFRCRYCERWKRETGELSTDQVLGIIDELKELGTIRISLSGGEPLMREDIGEIINYAKSKEISVVLTSNGSLVPKKFEEIKNLDLLKLSVEGEEKVHDAIRGKGSFRKVLKAIETLRRGTRPSRKSAIHRAPSRGLKSANTKKQTDSLRFVFNSVLTNYNLDQIGFLLNLAEKYGTGVRFSALNTAHATPSRIESLFPSPRDYQKAVEKLIRAKKRGRPVLNSFAGLNYLRTWPKGWSICHPDPKLAKRVEGEGSRWGLMPNGILQSLRSFRMTEGRHPEDPERRAQNDTHLTCFAGKGFAHLSADGKLYPCVPMEKKIAGREVLKSGFSRAFASLPNPKCSGCWCSGTLELNLLLSLKPSSILNLKKLI